MDDDTASSTIEQVAVIPQATHRETQSIAEAKFLLKLREGHPVSQVALTEVVNGCQTLFEQAIEGLREKTFQTLFNSGIDPSNVDGLDDLFLEFPRLFQAVGTQYRLNKFCVEHFSVVVSFFKLIVYML